MKTHLLRRAAHILVEKVRELGYNLEQCRLTIDTAFRENGFLVVYVTNNGRTITSISQDTYSLDLSRPYDKNIHHEEYRRAENELVNLTNRYWKE